MEKYSRWEDVPDHLLTKTALSRVGLKPAKGQEVVAVKVHWSYKIPDYKLYDKSRAVPRRTVSDKQRQTLTRARRKAMTTSCCNRYVGVINWRFKGNMCADCYAEWEHREHMEFLRDAQAEASQWAREVLADEQAVILDSETTALWGEIVELAIMRVGGEVLFDRLIRPVEPITANAEKIHKIKNSDVVTAATWPEVYLEIKQILESASRVVIYNADYDVGRIIHACQVWSLEAPEYRSECAMLQYAAWYGEWSDYHGSFRWQSLDGGHRALGDCQATLEVLRRMAESGGDDA